MFLGPWSFITESSTKKEPETRAKWRVSLRLIIPMVKHMKSETLNDSVKMLALQPEVGSIITICLKTKVFPVNQNEKTSQLRDLKKPKTALTTTNTCRVLFVATLGVSKLQKNMSKEKRRFTKSWLLLEIKSVQLVVGWTTHLKNIGSSPQIRVKVMFETTTWTKSLDTQDPQFAKSN